jgi:hypothetical protein
MSSYAGDYITYGRDDDSDYDREDYITSGYDGGSRASDGSDVECGRDDYLCDGNFVATTNFSTPDQQPDTVPASLEIWSSYVSRLLDEGAGENGSRFYNSARAQGFENYPNLVDISWSAFPNKLFASCDSDEDRWAKADSNFPTRDWQDEYCEWSVKKNDDGKIVKVVLTCELPEVKRNLH